MQTFPAVFNPEGEAINITFPDVPEAVTCGFSRQQAIEYATDALVMALGEYMRKRLPAPRPSVQRGEQVREIHVPALVQAKLALYTAMLDRGMRKADLAHRMGWHKNQVERLMDLTHASKMDQIESALQVLGKMIYVGVVDAA